MAPAPLAGETSGLRFIQTCLCYENAIENPPEIKGSGGSFFRELTMPQYFLQSAWAGKLESYREKLMMVKMRQA